MVDSYLMEFSSRTLTLGSAAYRYLVYVPSEWSADKEWPVILFLHGAGERGDDNTAQARRGISRVTDGELPCVVVLPQCPLNRWWPEPDMQAVALQAFEQSVTEFNGDRKRLYLTGMSMGGYGTWAIAAMNPGMFAALAPVCGGVRPPAMVASRLAGLASLAGLDLYQLAAQRIGKTPVWAFHGDSDPIVPVEESRRMVAALERAGGNVRYTEYAGVAHNSWDYAYAEPEFFPWMLAQRLV